MCIFYVNVYCLCVYLYSCVCVLFVMSFRISMSLYYQCVCLCLCIHMHLYVYYYDYVYFLCLCVYYVYCLRVCVVCVLSMWVSCLVGTLVGSLGKLWDVSLKLVNFRHVCAKKYENTEVRCVTFRVHPHLIQKTVLHMVILENTIDEKISLKR